MTDKSVQEVTNLLFAGGVLIELNIGRWSANKKLNASDLLAENTIDSKVFYLGHKKLVPGESLHALQEVEGKARTFLAGRSAPFPIANARYVAAHALDAVQGHLGELKAKFNEAIEDFLLAYPQLKAQQLTLLDNQADKIAAEELKKTPAAQQTERWHELKQWLDAQQKINRELYPTVEDLRTRFYFRWRIFKISPVEGANFDTMNAEIEVEIEKWVKASMAQFHKQLGERAAKTRALLTEQGKLNPKNLKPLHEALEEFTALDFTKSSQFHGLVNQIKDKFFKKGAGGTLDYDITAELLNASEASKKELDALLSAVSGLTSDAAAKQAGIKALAGSAGFRRFVDITEEGQ